MSATVIELLKKDCIKFSNAPDPAPAYCESDPETQQLRFRIRYPMPSTSPPPALPSMDDILSKIPPGSVTSILVVSSLPGNGFWPIILPENARSAGDFSTLPASDSLCTINFYRLCFTTLKGAQTSRQRPRRARGRARPAAPAGASSPSPWRAARASASSSRRCCRGMRRAPITPCRPAWRPSSSRQSPPPAPRPPAHAAVTALHRSPRRDRSPRRQRRPLVRRLAGRSPLG